MGGGWVVGCKCLWILRGEVWAVALGWRDGWEWCLKSQAFVQTNMGQARSDNGRLQGQGGLKLAGYSSWNGILSYGYFYFIFFPVWLFLNWYEQETVGTLGKIQRSWANPQHTGGSLQLISHADHLFLTY